jgi:putative oxidoreductase
MMIVRMALSIALGGVFLFGALSKLRHQKSFILTVVEYRILPLKMSKLYALLIPPLELLVALMAITGVALSITAIIMSCLLISFIIAIGVNVIRGRDFDCGCFGSMKRGQISKKLLVYDGLLLGMAILLTIITPKWIEIEPWSVSFLLGAKGDEGLLMLIVCIGFTISITIMGKLVGLFSMLST